MPDSSSGSTDNKRVAIPVKGSPFDAPFIFVDNLFAIAQLGDVIKLHFVQNAILRDTEDQGEGRYAVTLVMTPSRFENMVNYLNKNFDDIKKNIARASNAADDQFDDEDAR